MFSSVSVVHIEALLSLLSTVNLLSKLHPMWLPDAYGADANLTASYKLNLSSDYQIHARQMPIFSLYIPNAYPADAYIHPQSYSADAYLQS